MLVAWRDDGYWTLTWLRWSYRLRHGRMSNLPGPGFVGQESSSFRDTGAKYARLQSTRLHRIASTPGAPLWRLICVWAPYQTYPEVPYGNGLVPGGK
jgi:hypothetical protein